MGPSSPRASGQGGVLARASPSVRPSIHPHPLSFSSFFFFFSSVTCTVCWVQTPLPFSLLNAASRFGMRQFASAVLFSVHFVPPFFRYHFFFFYLKLKCVQSHS